MTEGPALCCDVMSQEPDELTAARRHLAEFEKRLGREESLPYLSNGLTLLPGSLQ